MWQLRVGVSGYWGGFHDIVMSKFCHYCDDAPVCGENDHCGGMMRLFWIKIESITCSVCWFLVIKGFWKRNWTLLSPETENRMMMMMRVSVLAVVAAAAGGAPGLPGDLPWQPAFALLDGAGGDGPGQQPGLGRRVLLEDQLGGGHPLAEFEELLTPGERHGDLLEVARHLLEAGLPVLGLQQRRGLAVRLGGGLRGSGGHLQWLTWRHRFTRHKRTILNHRAFCHPGASAGWWQGDNCPW